MPALAAMFCWDFCPPVVEMISPWPWVCHAIQATRLEPSYEAGPVRGLLRARTSDSVERLFVGGGGMGLDADAVRYAADNIAAGLGGGVTSQDCCARCAASRHSACAQSFPAAPIPQLEEIALLAGIFNAPSYGAGVRLAPRAEIDDGWLDVAFVKDLSALQVLTALLQLVRSGTLPEAYVKRARARCVMLPQSALFVPL